MAIRAPYTLTECCRFFEEPATPRQRQYEALRAFFVEEMTSAEAAERFGEFTKPVLIAWAPEDRFFKLRYAERLASAFPDARLELIEDSYTFVALDLEGYATGSLNRTWRSPTASSRSTG